MGASLSSISVFSSAVKQKLQNNDIAAAEQLLERMSTDAQEMVSGMSEMVWTISPHNDTIEKLTDRLQYMLRDPGGKKYFIQPGL
jgi:signal transduction histidine kinase